MQSRSISFQNDSGLTLSARLDLPAHGQPYIYALFAHCFTCTKNLSAVRHIAHELTQRNIGIFSFDFTGLGQSEGEFAKGGFSNQAGDLVSAAYYMEHTLDAAPTLMIGHSLGGTATLYAARTIDAVRGVVTIGSPMEPKHVIRLFEDDIKQVEEKGIGEVCIGGRPFTITRQFLNDLRTNPPETWLPTLGKDTLIFHAPGDTVVPIKNAERIFMAVRHPKSFVSLDKADHMLSRDEDAIFVAATIAGWASRHLPDAGAFDTDLKTDRHVVVRIGTQNYTTDVVAGKHAMISDEPSSAGGSDLGAGPYDYLLGSLGACTAITLRMYAERKSLPVEEVRVHLSHTKIDDPDTGKKIDLIERDLEIDGDLTEKQRTRMTQIADLCPVHRTLENTIRIETTLLHP